MAHEFRLLRNRIEAEVHAPALLLVTSATDRDGAPFTAHGLSESLSKTKQRIVLVTSDPAAMPAAPTPSAPAPVLRRRASDRLESSAHSVDGGFATVAISPERLATISRSSVAELVADLRSRFDYIVVDAGHLPKNSFGLLLVSSADAVLLAFRGGRTQMPEDRVMMDTLERAEARILGTVMTAEPMADNAGAEADADARSVTTLGRPPKRIAAIFQRLEVAFSRLGK